MIFEEDYNKKLLLKEYEDFKRLRETKQSHEEYMK